MVCPFEAADKQALLEAPTPADRAATLLALLRIDTHDSGSDRSRAS
jgi:Lon protease-like protein